METIQSQHLPSSEEPESTRRPSLLINDNLSQHRTHKHKISNVKYLFDDWFIYIQILKITYGKAIPYFALLLEMLEKLCQTFIFIGYIKPSHMAGKWNDHILNNMMYHCSSPLDWQSQIDLHCNMKHQLYCNRGLFESCCLWRDRPSNTEHTNITLLRTG